MFTSLLTGWLGRARAPRALALRVEVSQTATGTLIRVKGDPRGECAGALLGGLPAPAARRPAVVTRDLRGLRSISPLAVRVLAGYRRSVARTGGQLLLTGVLQPAVKAALSDFFETDADTAGAPPSAPGTEDGPCRCASCDLG